MYTMPWTFRVLDTNQDFEVIKAQSCWHGFGCAYEFRLTTSSSEVMDMEQLKEGYLEWNDAYGKPMRAYGWIRRIRALPIQDKKALYQITLSSPLLALNQNENTQIFLGQRPPDLVSVLVKTIPQSFWRLSYQLKKSYSQEPFFLQYRKSDFDFLQDLSSRFGFWYYETFGYPINQCFLCDQLDLDASSAKSMAWVTSSGMVGESVTVFDFQYQENRETGPAIRARTDDAGLSVGQLIHLEGHPAEGWNNVYRIVRMRHHFDSTAQSMRYWNRCDLLPLRESFVWSMPREKRTLLLPAHIEAPDASTPFLNRQGRYKVKLKCDAVSRPIGANSPFWFRLQDSGSTQYHTPFGIHFPLRHGTEVAISFLENDFEKPIILGALSHPLCPNVVSAENSSQYRIRTYGGNGMIWEDSPSNEYIHWHTAREEQELKLHAASQNSYIRMANQTGDLRIEAQKKLQILVQQDALFRTQNHYSLHVGGKTIELVYGSQWLSSGTDIQIQTGQDLKWSITGQHLKIQSQQASYQAQNFIHFLSEKGHVSIQAKNISGQAQTIHLFSRGKMDVGGAIQITSEGISGNVILCAPSITCKPAAGGDNEAGIAGEVLTEKKKKPVPNEAPKIFDLIALNLREDTNSTYFECPKSKGQKDSYKKDRLSSTELGYFVQQGNNAVIFIHGYNVGYGDCGGPIKTADDDRLDKSIFKRTDICRPFENVKNAFPDYTDGLLKENVRECLNGFERTKKIESDLEAILNGTGMHNWWLHMEWNLNCATKQFDQQNFDHYTRLCHIAWQGDPTSSLDYMAAEDVANRVIPKAVAAIQPLINQGIKVNIIAHSLGCRVLLGIMEQLGKDAKGHKKTPLGHVFLWQPSVPDDAFTNEFPNAYLAAQKITVLYSDHDNVLGKVPDGQNANFWRKMTDPNTGFLLACVVGVIHCIDQKFRCDVESPYHFAKTMQYPISQLWREQKTRLKFYFEWIQRHQEKNSTRSDARWYSKLKHQLTYIELKYPDQYRFLTILIESVQRKDIVSACRYSAFWYLGEIPSELLEICSSVGGFSALVPFAIQWVEKFSEKRAFKNADDASRELAAIILTVFTSEPTDEKAIIRPAMGYSGPDLQANHAFLQHLYDEQKLKLVDQKDILIEHSSMKIPNEEMKQKIYEFYICGEDGLDQLGCYVYDAKLKRYRLRKYEEK